jgi:hypothetical protein
MWVSGSTIFFHIISKRHDFRKKKRKRSLNIKYVLRISLQFCLQHFHSKRNWARCKQKCILSSYKVPVLVRFWWNLNFFRQILEKY